MPKRRFAKSAAPRRRLLAALALAALAYFAPPPGNSAAAHDPVKEASQPGRRSLFFRMGDSGQARPDIGGLLAVGGMGTHDYLPG